MMRTKIRHIMARDGVPPALWLMPMPHLAQARYLRLPQRRGLILSAGVAENQCFIDRSFFPRDLLSEEGRRQYELDHRKLFEPVTKWSAS
jgi:hypothetical protein